MGMADAPSLGRTSRPARLIDRLGAVSTPAVLWAGMIGLVVGCLAFGAVGVRGSTHRQDAVSSVNVGGAPLVAAAEALYVALADADAAASTAFLRAGLEPKALRDRYLADIERASQELVTISGQAATSPSARQEVARIAERLPEYAGLIESARTNNRLGFAVGAAYQRRASDVMRQELLPAATNLYETAARRIDGGYRAGSSRDAELALVATAVVVTALLVLLQVYLARRTRRVCNLGLATATLLVVGLCAWVVAGLEAQRESLLRSQRDGSDPSLVLSTARILALRSLSDENLDLIERGTDQANIDDFEAVTASIGDSDSGLLAIAAGDTIDGRAGSGVERIIELHGDYLAAHDRVRELAAADDYRSATEVAVVDQAEASVRLDQALAGEIDRARRALDSFAGDAADRLRWMPAVIVAVSALAAAAVAAGMWPRIKEYR